MDTKRKKIVIATSFMFNLIIIESCSTIHVSGFDFTRLLLFTALLKARISAISCS